MPESLPLYVDDELEKLQNSFDNMAIAADSSAAARVSEEAIVRADADGALATSITTVSTTVDGHTSEIEFLLSRSEEHTSELQSLMRISYAVFCLKKQLHKTAHVPPTSHIE